MINSRAVLYSPGANDECRTPAYAVQPLLKYLRPSAVIWCPFDTVDSQFVKIFSQSNKVIHSHLSAGQDFYNYEPTEWDVLISNPPFTCKRQIFERALSFNKPFALLMSNTWLNNAAPKQVFAKKDLQLLMFEQRVKFLDKYGKPLQHLNKAGKLLDDITFSSSFYCWKFLPKQIIMEKLNIGG